MRTTMKIVGNGKVTIPKIVRDELDLGQGDIVELDVRPVKRE